MKFKFAPRQKVYQDFESVLTFLPVKENIKKAAL